MNSGTDKMGEILGIIFLILHKYVKLSFSYQFIFKYPSYPFFWLEGGIFYNLSTHHHRDIFSPT